ncbi:SusC/RagA family TonB-linked outer membrane protein [Parabacteroides sp. HGS0025]|nr:SusC/RagA family TonB-linked outer membrane protein [Parabacteroides sp. HGS0025]
MKKLFLSGSLPEKDSGRKQICRVMKLTVGFLLLCSCFAFANHAYSQNEKVSLNKIQVQLEDVLSEIEDQTNYLFISNRELDLTQKVSVHAANESVQEVLNEVLKDTGLTFSVEGVNIILTQKEVNVLIAQQQVKNISGKIVDQNGEPVIGANVVEKGTANGVISDLEGRFSIRVQDNAELQISYIGYVDQIILVAGKENLEIVLKEDYQNLDEIVVVGYGVQKKKLVTGATVQVKGDDLQKLNTVNPLGALQSQAPGVSIVKNSGVPGEGFKISVRGVGTTGNSTPLYIVDGVTTGSIDHLSPADIESIDVLKDAASAAIYGARAANGVVLVVTKQGRKGKASISYDGYVGIQNLYKDVETLNAKEFALIMNEAAVNSGMPEYDFPSLVPDWDKIQNGTWSGTDWLDELKNKNAFTQNHALGITGGTEQSVYSLGLSYTSQEGVLGQPSAPQYSRYTFRINTEYSLIKGKSFDILKFGENLSYSHVTKESVGGGGDYLFMAMKTSPFLPVYDEKGDYHYAIPWNPYDANPVGFNYYRNSGNINKTNYLRGNAYMVLQPIKGLTWRSSFGIDMSASSYRSFIPVYSLSTIDDGYRTESEVNQNMSVGLKWIFENTVNYETTINEIHNLNVLLGTSAEKSGIGESLSGKNLNSIFDDFKHGYLDNTKIIYSDKTSLHGSPWEQGRLLSFFGRINYDYKEKYMATFVMRADASSNFAPNKRWGYFPSVSAGWVVSNESFMEDVVSWLDFFKLRASWGRNGNQAISPFQYLSTIAFDTGYFPGIEKTNWTTAAYPNIMSNPDVTWETSEQTDIGFDSRFFNSRLGFTFDWYNKTTKDWLVQAPILGIMGTGAPYINGGDVRNRGWEVALSWRDNIRDFSYGVNLNFAHNDNEVLRIANSEGIIHGPSNVLANGTAELYRAEEGFPLGYFGGYKTGGVFQNQQQIDNYVNSNGEKIMPDAVPGDLIFINQNDDNVIDDGDKIMIGDPNPDFIFSFSFNLGYKGLDLNMTSNGVFGNQIAKSYRRFADRPHENYTKDVLGRWHGEGTSNTIPRVNMATHINDTYVSDRYIENGDYWRISNLTIGYDFKYLWKKLPLNQARLYVTGQNILMVTGYSGFDPEVGNGNNWAGGIDNGFYPAPMSFLIGVSLKY